MPSGQELNWSSRKAQLAKSSLGAITTAAWSTKRKVRVPTIHPAIEHRPMSTFDAFPSIMNNKPASMHHRSHKMLIRSMALPTNLLPLAIPGKWFASENKWTWFPIGFPFLIQVWKKNNLNTATITWHLTMSKGKPERLWFQPEKRPLCVVKYCFCTCLYIVLLNTPPFPFPICSGWTISLHPLNSRLQVTSQTSLRSFLRSVFSKKITAVFLQEKTAPSGTLQILSNHQVRWKPWNFNWLLCVDCPLHLSCWHSPPWDVMKFSIQKPREGVSYRDLGFFFGGRGLNTKHKPLMFSVGLIKTAWLWLVMGRMFKLQNSSSTWHPLKSPLWRHPPKNSPNPGVFGGTSGAHRTRSFNRNSPFIRCPINRFPIGVLSMRED